jgi:hypothetical protein
MPRQSQLDHLQPKSCPNHEEDFKRKHSISGFIIFLAIVLPIAATGGIGY